MPVNVEGWELRLPLSSTSDVLPPIKQSTQQSLRCLFSACIQVKTEAAARTVLFHLFALARSQVMLEDNYVMLEI